MAYEDANKAWIPGGVAGLVIAIYGSYHFKTLMALREVCIIFMSFGDLANDITTLMYKLIILF